MPDRSDDSGRDRPRGNKRTLPWRTTAIVGALLTGLTLGGCVGPAFDDQALLERYRDPSPYRLAVIEAGTPDGEQTADAAQFTLDLVLQAEAYARQMGVNLAESGQSGSADRRIVVTVEQYSFEPSTRGAGVNPHLLKITGKAELLYSGVATDSFTFNKQFGPLPLADWRADDSRKLTELRAIILGRTAVDIIDEYLLAWQPPEQIGGDGKPVRRSPTPEHALASVGYTPRFGIAGAANRGFGGQVLHRVDSRTPELSWEGFPRPWDVLPDGEALPVENVVYDLRIHGARQRGDLALLPFGLVYERNGLKGNSYKLEQKLEYCTAYFWTVRARFMLNGVPRATEWAGANRMREFNSRPWAERRGTISWSDGLPASAVRYLIGTPAAPWSNGCG